MRRVAAPSDVQISFGSRGLTALAVGVGMLIALGLCLLLIRPAMTGTVPGAVRVLCGLLGALAAAGILAAAVVLIRNPRLISRAIVITPSAVLLPVRRFGPIPIDEIAGVGLALQRNPRSHRPGGNWVLAIWRQDGSRAYAGGLQRETEIKDPAHSQIANAAQQLHELVRDRQGPDGPLARRQLQRHANFGPFESFTASWDPAPSD